jgi:hypothetical protein
MRVLFVVKEYLPKPTPPGLCVMNVQKALLAKGVQSDVLMVGEEEGFYKTLETGDVFCIKSGIRFEKKKESLIDYLKVHLPMVITWPIPSTKRVNDYRRMIQKLNEEKHYDAIIGTMFPPDVCVACSYFDHFFLYELDSLINNPMYKSGLKKHLGHRLKRVERRLFNSAEFIIHLNNNKLFYSKERYNKYSAKSVYTDIPELTRVASLEDNQNLENGFTKENKENQIVMVYSGHLSKDYRSPTKLISLIKAMSETINISCLFFSRGDCEDELRQAEIDTNGIIKRMGYVSQEELSKYTHKADFLLDIGNRLSGEDYSLPSKVICYMAMGKPIIHINGVNDSAIKYLEKYGLAINISEESDIKDAAKQTIKFINSNRGKIIPFDEVAEKFPQNTPEYTAELIISQIQNRLK